MTSKIQTLCNDLQNAFPEREILWYNTGGGCMCVRIALGDDKVDWSDVLIGEGSPEHGGPDSFGYSDLDDDSHVSGVWFASTSGPSGEPDPEPLLMQGNTVALIRVIREHLAKR